jgi:hypothetical protein
MGALASTDTSSCSKPTMQARSPLSNETMSSGTNISSEPMSDPAECFCKTPVPFSIEPHTLQSRLLYFGMGISRKSSGFAIVRCASIASVIQR